MEFLRSSYMFDEKVPVRERKLFHLLSVKKSKHVQSAPPPRNSNTHTQTRAHTHTLVLVLVLRREKDAQGASGT